MSHPQVWTKSRPKPGWGMVGVGFLPCPVAHIDRGRDRECMEEEFTFREKLPPPRGSNPLPTASSAEFRELPPEAHPAPPGAVCSRTVEDTWQLHPTITSHSGAIRQSMTQSPSRVNAPVGAGSRCAWHPPANPSIWVTQSSLALCSKCSDPSCGGRCGSMDTRPALQLHHFVSSRRSAYDEDS
jgi:hypothetical protein